MSKQLPTVPIFGVPFSKMSMDETVHYLTEAIEDHHSESDYGHGSFGQTRICCRVTQG